MMVWWMGLALAAPPMVSDGVATSASDDEADFPILQRDERADLPVVNGVVGGPSGVVALVWVDPANGSGAVFCSATMITGRWAITAAHCVDAIEGEFAGMEIWVSFSEDTYQSPWDGIQTDTWIKHPGYVSGDLHDDIALVRLTSVRNSSGAIPLNDEPVTDAFIGSDLTFVGFGITTDTGRDEGVRRKANIPFQSCLDGPAAYFVPCSYSDAPLLFSEHPTRNVCSGDSGGAALELDGGRWELVGVNSAVTPGCVGGANIAVRVDRYIDWILSIVPWASLGPTSPTDPGTDPGTDPATDPGTQPDPGTATDPATDPGTATDPGSDPASGADTAAVDTATSPHPPCGCASSTSSGSGALAWLLLLALRRRSTPGT